MTDARQHMEGRNVRGGSFIAAAIGTMNIATYAFTMIAARWLGPQKYGALAALLGLIMVLGVLQLGLQAAGARRISAAPGDVGEIERSVLGVSYRSAVVLGLLCLVFSPLINDALSLHSLGTAALVAATVVPMTIMGGQAGVLQGERRWAELAVVYLANGVPRLVIGSALILWRPDEFTAMLAVALGQYVPVLVGWRALRRSRPTAETTAETTGTHDARAVLLETAHSSHALLAFFALSNVDVLVARSVLDGHQAGLYAAGLIAVKAVLFLPQFVVIVAFPSMSSEGTRRSVLIASLTAVACIGAVCALGAKLLSGLALIFVGGDEYASIQSILWQFAILGTLLSMLQLLVYSVLARQARASVYLIWVGLVVAAATGQAMDNYRHLLHLMLATDGALFVVLLAVSLWRLRKPARVSEMAVVAPQ